MRRRDVLWAAAIAAATCATPVLAADQRSRRARDAASRERADEADRRADRRRERDGDAFEARAANDDPSGNYKSYPDWARATLGTRVFGK